MVIVYIFYKGGSNMLKIVQDVSTKRYGVDDPDSMKVIIRTEYDQIFIHRYGISCLIHGEKCWEVFRLDGSPILKRCKNVLFLDRSRLLLVSPNGFCTIYDCSARKFLFNMKVESVLVFIGDSEEATEFNENVDAFDIFMSTNYLHQGAHIESLLCAKIHGLWGVINLENNSIMMDFICKKLRHRKGNDISVVN